jgi:hypothetical protein
MLILKEVEGFAVEEIAVLDLNANTVKVPPSSGRAVNRHYGPKRGE